MKFAACALICLLAAAPSFAEDEKPAYSAVQGEIIAIGHDSLSRDTILLNEGQLPKALFCREGSCAILVAIDMKLPPGIYREPLVTWNDNEVYDREVVIEVTAGHFPEQKLTLPKRYVEPDKATLERIEAENRLIREALAAESAPRPILEPFVIPLKGKLTTHFGMKRVLNGQPRNQHSGVDIKAPVGEKVFTVGDGKVILTGDFFYNGKSVFIDHGSGIYSMYFHLSEIAVETGDEVKRGATVGRVGSTGRSTGPHLHFGMKMRKAAVDPMRFISLTQGMYLQSAQTEVPR